MELNLNLFFILLFIDSALTILFTQGVKIALGDREYSSNLVAGLVSIVVSLGFGICICILYAIPVTSQAVVFFLLLTVLSWLGSMIGYDKLKQSIVQILDITMNLKNKLNK